MFRVRMRADGGRTRQGGVVVVAVGRESGILTCIRVCSEPRGTRFGVRGTADGLLVWTCTSGALRRAVLMAFEDLRKFVESGNDKKS